MFGSCRQIESIQRAGDRQRQAMSASQFLFGRLSCKDSCRAAGTNIQRLRRKQHPNQRAVAESLHSFDYVSCRIRKILRETTGRGRRADYSIDSEQIPSGTAVSERICRCTLQERGYFALGCRLRVLDGFNTFLQTAHNCKHNGAVNLLDCVKNFTRIVCAMNGSKKTRFGTISSKRSTTKRKTISRVKSWRHWCERD